MKIPDADAEPINAVHFAAFGRHDDAAMKRVVECGRLLILAKARLGHGNFLPWILKHCDFSSRTASIYMRLFRQYNGSGTLPPSVRSAYGASCSRTRAHPEESA